MAVIGEWIPISGLKNKADANKIAQELEQIGYRNNTDEFNTQEVVDYARNNPSSEIHKVLEWNDTVAAEAYRNEQVRKVLQYIKITYVDDTTKEKDPQLVRYFINTGKRNGTYKKTEILLKDANEANTILENMKRDALTFINRYKMYVNLNPALASALSALQTIINP